MIRCMCLVQAGQTPDAKQVPLQNLLNDFSERAFGQPADIIWTKVPAQSGYTAGKPSTSSIVSMTAAKPIAQETRVDLLGELCDIWMGETGCSLNEIVAVINDPKPN